MSNTLNNLDESGKSQKMKLIPFLSISILAEECSVLKKQVSDLTSKINQLEISHNLLEKHIFKDMPCDIDAVDERVLPASTF